MRIKYIITLPHLCSFLPRSLLPTLSIKKHLPQANNENGSSTGSVMWDRVEEEVFNRQHISPMQQHKRQATSPRMGRHDDDDDDPKPASSRVYSK